jgi:RND family efflux transporter MFP subunit
VKLIVLTQRAARIHTSLAFLSALLVITLMGPAPGQAEPVTISGYTMSSLDSKLGLAVTGKVRLIHVEEGQIVKQGQALLELEQQAERLEMERRELIWENRTEIDAVSRQLKTLASQLEDSQSLYDSNGSIPREDLENQQLEFELTEIDHKRLEVAEEREKREYGIAREEVRKRTLRAPFSGEVVKLLIGVGENCEPDTQLLHLVNTEQVDFVANLDLATSRGLELHETVELQFPMGGSSVTREANITFISPVVDLASGLLTIKARFDNSDGEIVPGITGTMRFDSQ